MKDIFKANIILGKESTKIYDNFNQQLPLEDLKKIFDERMTTIEYETTAELNAYFKGIEGMNGWLDNNRIIE